MIKIRAATQRDAEYLAAIYQETTGLASNWFEAIGNAVVLVAEVDGRVVGFGGTDLKTMSELKWLYVLAETQRLGIGSALLKTLETMAASAGLDTIRLHAAPEAVEFYQRHGYCEVPIELRHQHNHEGVEMMKEFGQIF